MQLTLDAESEARIERHKAHLPDGKDLTLLVLKGHLLVEEGLDELITAACPEPKHIFDGNPEFSMKARIARSLTAHLVYPGLWPMIGALNRLRNELAHELDSPELERRMLAFMQQRQEQMHVMHDQPIDPGKHEENLAQLRTDISLLVAQLTGGALAIRTIVKRVEPWQKMIDEFNKA